MKNEKFVVNYVRGNDCFACLSDDCLRQSDLNKKVIQVTYNGENYYLSYRLKSIAVGKVYLSSTFAKRLGIEDQSEVFISIVDSYVPELKSVFVVPKTEQDREIIELHFDRVQYSLLNQISVVANRQPIVVWVSKFCSSTLIVESLSPDYTFGHLVEDTEIHISDTTLKSRIENDSDKKEAPQNWINYKTQKSEIFRCVVHKSNQSEAPDSPYKVFVEGSDLIHKLRSERKSIVCKISKLRESVEDKNLDVTPMFVSVSLTDKEDNLEKDYSGETKSLFISPELSLNLKLQNGAKVRLHVVEELSTRDVTSIEIYPVDGTVKEEDIVDYVKNRSNKELLLLNASNCLKLDNGSVVVLKILPLDCLYGLFDSDRLSRLKINIHKIFVNIENTEKYLNKHVIDSSKLCPSMTEDVIKECLTSINLQLKIWPANINYNCDNILIYGSTGSGKTTICRTLREHLNASPYNVHTVMMNCTVMKGKKAEIIHKFLTNILAECIYYQFSVLILDNLESIANQHVKQEENSMEYINAARITDTIFKLITEMQCLHKIVVIATCQDYNLIGDKLRIFQGNHFFRNVLTIPELNKTSRINILKTFCQLKSNVSDDINWQNFGNMTHGWVYKDFEVVTEKAAFIAWKRHVEESKKNQLCIEECDLTNAIKNFKPINLHNINLVKNEGNNWSNIGGLTQVKKTLTELLHWPLKYHNLFKTAPIKQQSGILLYGMPGTGKTMIASSVAKEFGINLISVKGPELLSKYIGASEEAVRNIFLKAQAARPCVLFFDEFDSLAPRRGHDNTGVTDRVVNQLLTQLDGIEGRDGIAIVAATSRPDLIDPAILRPGRLDKIILCPLPNENDRREILSILSKNYQMDIKEEELSELVGSTEGFTPADLNVLFKQAKLNVMDQTLDYKSKKDQLFLTMENILDALKLTKPSISVKEKNRFSSLYQNFSNQGPKLENAELSKRVTLA